MLPHIGIEARLISDERSGIAQYTYQLSRILKNSSRIKLTLFDDEYFKNERDFEKINARGLKKIGHVIWLNTRFPRILESKAVDLVHSPNFLPPMLSKIPSVVTFHDLGFLRYPHTHHWLYAKIYPALAKEAVVKAQRIIVPSESSYMEIAHYYPKVKDKVRIIPESAGEHFKVMEDKELLSQVQKKYKLPVKFFLIVGTLEPRKNLERFFRAFKIFNVKHPGSEFRLVLCGKSWLRHKEFLTELEGSGIKDRVSIIDYVPQEELVAVYNSAYTLAFPSYYEGFGIPAVEAMKCGIPVIASNAFSLPEVLGDAGLYFHPFEVGEMAEAIEKIALDTDLRKELSSRGLKRAEDFSWEKTAKMTEEVYLEVLNSNL